MPARRRVGALGVQADENRVLVAGTFESSHVKSYTSHGFRPRHAITWRRSKTVASLLADQLLAAVDVVRRSGKCGVDHQVYGDRRDV